MIFHIHCLNEFLPSENREPLHIWRGINHTQLKGGKNK